MGRVLAVALAALLLAGCSKAYDETHRVVDRIFSFYRRKSPRQRPQAHPALSTITVTPEGRFIADGVQAATLTVRLRDAKGKPVPGQPVQLTVSGVGVVVSDPGVTDVQGVASATLAATRAGTKRVTVLADPGATNIRLHQEPVVEFDPAPPVQVAFAVQPAATVEGTTIPPVLRVEVRDVVGNVVTDATHAVSVSIGTNPGSGTVSGTITAAAVAGVATFGNLSIDRAGLGYRLAASASGLTGGASASFDVMPVAEVSFESAASDTPGETAGAHAVRVALSMPFGSLLSPVGVTVSDAGGGTATSGADYGVFAPATLGFPAGSTSGAILSTPLSVLADTLIEGRETVRLAISGPTGPGRLGAGASHTATIVDDETATVAFATATSVSPGEAASALPVTVVLSTTGGATLASDLSVVATSTGGTATAGADYTAVTTTVTFAAGSGGGATRTVNIPVLADTLIEGSETVGLILSGISSNGALGAQTTHTATIGDDESASVAFTIAASATANETAGNHAVTATLSTTPGATLASALTVDASGVSGTATSGADYTAVATTLTFAAGSGNGATQTLNVPVLADTLIEGAETVGLALFNVSANGALGLQTTHAATITDDEALATVAFAAATSATAGEAAANHAVTVTLTTTGGATLGSAFTVSAASTGGTATAGTDYTAVATTVTFPAGSGNGATQAVNIPVLADLVFEGAETVVLTISSPSALGLLGATTTHTATITDDESATVAFTAAASATSGEAAANHGVTVTLSTSAGAT
ncbi:MAG: Ig-like domain-containing protein, partial [Planctomycetes bacterium]|nr:Ig-like domain-containing protein [Planctomycetota bacterium]